MQPDSPPQNMFDVRSRDFVANRCRIRSRTDCAMSNGVHVGCCVAIEICRLGVVRTNVGVKNLYRNTAAANGNGMRGDTAITVPFDAR